MTLFDFAEYLDLADDLLTRSDEAAWRSAISRAYYATLHVAFPALPPAIRGIISHRVTHRAVWQFYVMSSAQVCRQVGHAGIRLRDARVDSDYRAVVRVTQAGARRHVFEARQTQARIQQHGYQP